MFAKKNSTEHRKGQGQANLIVIETKSFDSSPPSQVINNKRSQTNKQHSRD